MAGYYDKNKDYSLAIKNAQSSGASKATIDKLRQERQNKIDAQYGGRDPYKGSSDIMGNRGGSSSSSRPSGPKYNYGGAYDPSKHDAIIDRMEQEAAKGENANWDAIGNWSAGLITGKGGMYSGGDGTLMNQVIGDLQKKYKYNADRYYGKKYDDIHGAGAWADPDFWGKPGQTVNKDYADMVYQTGNHGKPGGGLGSIGGGSGMMPQSGTAEDYLRQLYAAKKNALEEQLKQAMQQGQSDIESRNEEMEKRYAAQRNQLAAQRDLEQMRLGEMGMAQGLNTGAYGQLAAGQSSAYMGAMGDIMAQQQADRAESDRMLQQLMNRYNSALAQGNAQFDAQMYDALYDEYIRKQQEEAAAQQEQYRQQQYMEQMQAQQSAAARKDAEAKAKILAGYGDFSGYAALGYSPEEIAFMQRSFQAKNNKWAGGLYGGSGMPTSAPSKSYRGGSSSSRRNWDNGGLSRDQVRMLQQRAGVTADGLWGNNTSSAYGGLSPDEAWAQFGGRYQSPVRNTPHLPMPEYMKTFGGINNETRVNAILKAVELGRMSEKEAEKAFNDLGI